MPEAAEEGRSDDLVRLRAQAQDDKRLFKRAAQALAEIDRSQGLSDEHADVLAALRIRIEGKRRASLEDLLSATGDIAGLKGLGDVLSRDDAAREWPAVDDPKRDWPGA